MTDRNAFAMPRQGCCQAVARLFLTTIAQGVVRLSSDKYRHGVSVPAHKLEHAASEGSVWECTEELLEDIDRFPFRT